MHIQHFLTCENHIHMSSYYYSVELEHFTHFHMQCETMWEIFVERGSTYTSGLTKITADRSMVKTGQLDFSSVKICS